MNHLAFRLARRYSAAIDPAKMETLLLKIRKSEGKIATLSWANLGDVFAVLDPGWKLEKTVGIVKMYGRHDGGDKPVAFFDDSEDAVKRRHQELKKDAVTSLPASPKANQLYVLDLTEVSPSPYIKGAYEFRCRPWLGAEGWSITTSNGKTIEVLPDAYQLGELQHGYKKTTRTKIPTYSWVPVLNKETDWLAQIDKKLGLGSFEKTAPRTRESTGSCPCCFQNIKLAPDGEKMVLHGYRRPGTGTTQGSCFGVGYPAFELSVKGTKEYLKSSVEPAYKLARLKLERLQIKDLPSFSSERDPLNPRTITRDDPRWEHHLLSEKQLAEHVLGMAEAEFKAFTKLVQNWKPRPLPKEGERHIDWYFKGQDG